MALKDVVDAKPEQTDFEERIIAIVVLVALGVEDADSAEAEESPVALIVILALQDANVADANESTITWVGVAARDRDNRPVDAGILDAYLGTGTLAASGTFGAGTLLLAPSPAASSLLRRLPLLAPLATGFLGIRVLNAEATNTQGGEERSKSAPRDAQHHRSPGCFTFRY